MAEDNNKKKTNGEVADNNKKKVNGETPSPPTSKGSRYAEKLSRILSLLCEMKNGSAGALDYEKTVEENGALKSALKRRDDELKGVKAEVEKLNRTVSQNLDCFGMKYAEFQSKLKDGERAQGILATTQEKLGEAIEKMEKLESENKQLQGKAVHMETAKKRAERQLSEIQTECSYLRISLQSAQEKIEFYCEDSLAAQDPQDVEDTFEAFAEKFHQMAMECFAQCGAPPKNVSSVREHLERRKHPLPLTDRTTVSARLMRCAAAEFVIVNAMVEHIFTDVYMPQHMDRQRAVSETLDLLQKKDARRESLVRCQLLEEYPVDKNTLSAVSDAAFVEVCSLLDGLLPAADLRNKFHDRLRALLEEALELWQPLQRSKSRVCARLWVGTESLRREDAEPDYDGLNSQVPAMSQPVLLLFPMINTSDRIIFPATALWSDQGAFVEATKEASEDRLGVNGGMHSARAPVSRRRTSISRRTSTSPTSSLPPAAVLSAGSGVSNSQLGSSRRMENGTNLTGRDR